MIVDVRLYLPALRTELAGEPGSLLAHAVTAGLRAEAPEEDEEGLEMIAFLAAADDSVRRIAAAGAAPAAEEAARGADAAAGTRDGTAGTADGAAGTADGAAETADGAAGTRDGAAGTADGAAGTADGVGVAESGSPAVRVVLAAEVPDSDVVSEPGGLPTLVRLSRPVTWAEVRAIHVDEESTVEDVARAAAGDEEAFERVAERDLLWFDPSERPALVAGSAG